MTGARLAPILLLIALAPALPAQQEPTPPVILADSLLQWRQAGPDLRTARLEGDPAVADAPYALMLRLADGGWIPPHFHPREKRIMVLSGTLLLGFGDTIGADPVALAPGAMTLVPAGAHHYEGARGETTFVLYGNGPLSTTMVRQE